MCGARNARVRDSGDDAPQTMVGDDRPGDEAGPELVLAGRFDLSAAAGLRARALALVPRGGPLIVECGDLDTIDYASLQVLHGLRETLRQSGRTMLVMNIPPSLARCFGWMGLESCGDLWDEPS